MLRSAEARYALLAFSSLFSVINLISVARLITAVIGIQFIINGVTTVLTEILKASRTESRTGDGRAGACYTFGYRLAWRSPFRSSLWTPPRAERRR